MAKNRNIIASIRPLNSPQALRLKAETILQVIATSSEQLLRADNWRSIVADIFQRIGQACDISRIYMFEVNQHNDDDAIVSLLFEWVNTGIEPQINVPQLQNVSRKNAGLGRMTPILAKGQTISGTIDKFNDQERDFFQQQSIKSLAIVPIQIDSKWWGYIGFDECRTNRTWSDSDINLLKSISAMFGAAIEGEYARKALHDSESLFRLTFEQAGSGVVHIGTCLKLFRVNRKSCEILGYDKHELLNKSMEELCHRHDFKHLKSLLDEISDKCNQPTTTREVEKRLIRKDGSIVWVSMILSAIFDEVNRTTCFIGVFKNITARLETEKALYRSKKQYQDLVDAVDDIIWSTDTQSKWTFLNPATYNITGYHPDELLHNPCTDIFSSDETHTPKEIFNLVERSGRARYEVKILHKNGTAIVLSCNAALMRDKNGKIVGITGIARDITERKQAEKALRDSEERFQIVSRATNDVIWDWNIEHNTFWSNLEIQSLFGYSQKEIKSSFNWWKKLIHPADRRRVINELYNLMDNNRSFWVSEFRFRYGNGDYANVLDRGYIIYNSARKPVRMIGTLQDITDQKRNEQYLRNSRERLRNLASREQIVREEERQKLSRELHDEFAQILTALKMDINWFKRKLPENYTALQDRAIVMGKIIDSTMERVRQIASELRPALLDDLGLNAAIDWQVKQFYARTGCNCTTRIASEDLGFPKEIEIAVFRIFQEALSNIARHTNASQVDVGLLKNNNDILLEIKDNGGGIPEEKIYHMDSLGLIGMRERAGAFGGRLHIHTTPGDGTSVILHMPSQILSS